MPRDIDHLLGQLSWDAIGSALDRNGFAITSEPILTAAECAALVSTFDDAQLAHG